MGYTALIKNNLKKAFRIAGDLKLIAVFSHKVNSGYDFANQAVKQPKSEPLGVEGFFTEKSKGSQNGAFNAQFITLAEYGHKLDSYDEVTINGKVWKIAPPITNDGFIVTVNLVGEVKHG